MTSNNEYVISGSLDNTIRVWNLSEKKQETVLQGHLGGINSVAVTSDKKHIVFGSYDKTIRVWNLLKKDKKLFCKDI